MFGPPGVEGEVHAAGTGAFAGALTGAGAKLIRGVCGVRTLKFFPASKVKPARFGSTGATHVGRGVRVYASSGCGLRDCGFGVGETWLSGAFGIIFGAASKEMVGVNAGFFSSGIGKTGAEIVSPAELDSNGFFALILSLSPAVFCASDPAHTAGET